MQDNGEFSVWVADNKGNELDLIEIENIQHLDLDQQS